MKCFLLLWMVFEVSGFLKQLKDAKQCTADGIATGDATELFAIPYGDKDGTEKILILSAAGTPGSPSIKSPSENPIKNQTIAPIPTKLCYEDGTVANAADLKGKVYLVSGEYTDTSVWQWMTDSYDVTSTNKYIVIFAPDTTGSTLRNIKPAQDAKFVINSGLPDDNEIFTLFVYDPSLSVETIFLPDDHFHIVLDGALDFTVDKGGVAPKDQTFENSGFVLSPGFPVKPTDADKTVTIKIKPANVNRLVTFQVTAADSEDGTQTGEGMIELASSSSVGVEVSVGEIYFFIPGGSTKTKFPLPANTDSFVINGEVGYAVQFNIEDATPSTTTVSTAKPTDKSTAPPNPVVTSLTTPKAAGACTCPPIPECPCTSTTTISTTTQSATTASLFSAFSVFAVSQFL